MYKQQLDNAFFRTYVESDLDNDKVKIDVTWRCEDAVRCSCKLENPFANRLNEDAMFADAQVKANVNKIFYIDIKMTSDEPVVFPRTAVDIRFPLDNMQSLWLPSIIEGGKNYRAKGMFEYNGVFTTHICNNAPMGAFFSAEGANKLAFAFSDCLNIIKLRPGAYEEEECGRVNFEMFSVPCHKMTSYTATIRLDTSFIPVYEAIENMAKWYQKLGSIEAMDVPEAAFDPVYSTWYAFLQNITDEKIEEQCRIASSLGCKTVIVDDGWQTDDNNRGYTYCGDWQVSKNRFPNMKEHVKRVHDMGMKYMMWFSVPFIGRKCKNYEEYKDVCICFNPQWDAYVLDPRYKKARDFLVKTYVDTVVEYDLDGLKLDFIDQFDMRQADEKALAYDEKRDTQSLPDAVDMLMSEVRDALKAVRSDILIEFRQNYIGPMIRKYGNMFRAHDCPNDTLMNRMTTLDLRATSGNTAVHSDMFTWSPSESVESSSLNFIHTIFSVPQVSPNFTHLNEEHIQMVRNWLSFYNEHRELLMKGTIEAEHPELMYTLVRCTKDNEQVVQVNQQGIVDLFNHEQVKKIYMLNGSMNESLILRSKSDKKAKVEVFDCLGRSVRTQELNLNSNIQEFNMPKSGYAVLELM